MKQWVELDEGWLLRPTVEGLELIGQECNIALECQALQDYDKLVAVLQGCQEITQRNEDESIRQALQTLEAQGALRLTEQRPIQKFKFARTEQVLWRLHRHVVGSAAPISTVYWLDPRKSQFSPLYSHLFFAKHAMLTGNSEENMSEWASGTDRDRNIAELKAIAEGLERYASGVIPITELIMSSAEKIGKAALDPRLVVAYSRAQYKNGLSLIPFSKDRDYYWREVTTFPDGCLRYLPVECLYYPVSSELTPNLYTLANSSGVAAGFSFEDALVRGLYEAMERDAFMVVWLNRFVMPTIKRQILLKEQQQQIGRIEEIGYNVHLINLTLDLAPVVLAAAVSHERKPALVLGMASNLVSIKAITKALTEVEQQLYWDLREDTEVRTLSNPQEVDSVLDHMALYASQEHLSKASFLWKGKLQYLTDAPRSGYDELSTLVKILESQGKEVVVADLTPSSLKSAGIWVVRAIPLGLVPISFGYGMEPLGMRRIKEVPKRLSISQHSWQDNKPFTHPFC